MNREQWAYIAASRGVLHPALSTDSFYADQMADANMRRVNGQWCTFRPAWQVAPAGPMPEAKS